MNDRFTLVIPCYNESKNIAETLKTVRSSFEKGMQAPWKIIVSDNASTDGTADVVESLGDPRITALRLTVKGRGRAIRAGFKAAQGGCVAFSDADLPISPEDFIRAFDIVRSGRAEIVVGTRLKGGSIADRPMRRNIVSKVFHYLAVTITGLKASDSQCPLRVMNERTTPIMLATVDVTWWSELECVLLAEQLGIRMEEIYVQWHEARYKERKSTVKLFKDARNAIGAMFRMRSYLKPIKKSLEAQLANR